MKLLLPIVALCAVPTGVIAKPIAPNEMLVSSTPVKDGTRETSVDTISLNFAETVVLLDVTLLSPDGTEQQVFKASYEPGAPKTKGKTFDFPLATPVTTPGRYSISYLLTSKSIKSLNGYVDFEIEGLSVDIVPASDPIAPELIEATPADDLPDGDRALFLSTSPTRQRAIRAASPGFLGIPSSPK
jgi:methionine-rich copper-binding protein CopC